MSHILIVEDEPGMRIGLKDNFEFEGYKVDLAEDGEDGYERIMGNSYDIIILDVMLPKRSGFDICRSIREKGISTPVFLLTAKGEEIDKVLGLELGADDYITKPFSVRELLDKVKAVMRRGKKTGDQDSRSEIKIGRLTVNFTSYTANCDGRNVKMPHKEFEVLHYLLDNKNSTVSRYELLEKIWGYQRQPTTRTVDNFILKLRQKIEENPNDPKRILTVHGVGYKLVD